MKYTLAEARRKSIERLVIESVDLSLYIAFVEIEGEAALLVGADGKALRTRNLLDMKALLSPLGQVPAVLRQRSAYDEMCGQSWAPADNVLEVPLGAAAQPMPDWQH